MYMPVAWPGQGGFFFETRDRYFPSGKANRAFSLIEMLVVIAIIAILASLLMPALMNSLESAYRTGCQNRMKSLYSGLSMYSSDYNGYLPPSAIQQEVIWKGINYGSKYVNWTSEFFLGQYVGNHAINCTAVWQGRDGVSEVIYCTKATQSSALWRAGIGLNTRKLRLPQIKRPGILGIMSCVAFQYDTPTDQWRTITSNYGGQAIARNGTNFTGTWEPRNRYPHLEASNITFADGHIVGCLDAVLEEDQQRLSLSNN